MPYIKHKNIIRNYSAANILKDESISITYEELSDILQKLHDIFYDKDTNKITCVALYMENTVLHAIAILYFLSEQVNFYLVPSSPQSKAGIPEFCDKVVKLNISEFGPEKRVDKTVSINLNPLFLHSDEIKKYKGGFVFVSSSGTTGTRKIIRHSAGNLLLNASNCIDRFEINNASSILISVPINHMYGLGVGLIPALISGASLCIINKSNILKLFDAITEFSPSITLLTPSIIRMLLKLKKKISTKTSYISAGEKLGDHLHESFEKNYALLLNLYGSSELGAIGTSPIHDNISRYNGAFKPLNEVDIKIDKNSGQILCDHKYGAEAYVDSFGNELQPISSKGDFMNTKDIGKSDGSLFHVLGRSDNQVNRSGFLVMLEEVEMEIKRLFPELDHVVVFEEAPENQILGKLVAVCEINGRNNLEADKMRSICQRELTRYLQPDEIILTEKVPKLHNGKPDRNKIKLEYSK